MDAVVPKVAAVYAVYPGLLQASTFEHWPLPDEVRLCGYGLVLYRRWDAQFVAAVESGLATALFDWRACGDGP
jgi:hypothetical protein